MIQDHEYLAPQRIPRGWEFAGFDENFVGRFQMIGHIVGIKYTDFSVSTTCDSRLHIVVADHPLPDYFSTFEATGTGGLESCTKGTRRAGGAVTRQIHLTDSDHLYLELLKLWKTRQECRIGGVFYEMVDPINPLYEFKGFGVGCQCPVGRIDKIVKIEPETSVISEFWRSMKSVGREFVGLNN